MITRLAAAALALLLAGCATISPEERANACRSTDWLRFGLNDGKLGVPASERVDLFGECAEVGQPVDTVAYDTGRTQGLTEYCTAENGFRVGYEGRGYDGVCPPELEQDFLQGHERGRRERPGYAIYPRIGIGIGTGGVRGGVGIGVGSWYWGGRRHWRHRHPAWYAWPYGCGYWRPGCY